MEGNLTELLLPFYSPNTPIPSLLTYITLALLLWPLSTTVERCASGPIWGFLPLVSHLDLELTGGVPPPLFP